MYNWRASEASETLSGVYKFELVRYILASERSERDTIRGVQIRAGAVRICIYIYMYGGTYVIIVAHAMHA